MRATVERAEALRLLKIEHQAVEALIAELSDEEMTRGDTIRHGLYYDQQCSFKDLLAHLICYEVYTVEALGEWQAGREHWALDAVKDPRQGREIHYGGIAERAHLSLKEQLDEYRQTSQTLEAALEATQTGYEVGTRNIVEVLLAQRRLYQSQFDYASSRYDYVINLLRLKETAGALDERDVEELNAFMDAQNPVRRLAGTTGR
jgi:hypothetical protein